jgi:hypothetical protein
MTSTTTSTRSVLKPRGFIGPFEVELNQFPEPPQFGTIPPAVPKREELASAPSPLSS